MKAFIKKVCVFMMMAVCITGCANTSDMDNVSSEVDVFEIQAEQEEKKEEVITDDEVEELEDIKGEETEEDDIHEKEIADTFLYDLYYHEKEEYSSDYWERLEAACVEAIEGNEWEIFMEEHSAAYSIMTQEEKEDYAKYDVSGKLDFYMLEQEKEDKWYLMFSDYEMSDIIVRVLDVDEKDRYIYYMFTVAWGKGERIYYNNAVRALGSDEYYFLQYEKETYLVLIDRTEQGDLKGVAIHQYSSGGSVNQTILYFKIENGNHVTKIALYGGLEGEQKWIGYNSSYWPEYPE